MKKGYTGLQKMKVQILSAGDETDLTILSASSIIESSQILISGEGG
jgi:hypothetical protein